MKLIDADMRLCDLDEIKVCVDRQYENCHGYSGSKKAIYREAILAVKSILHSAKSIDGVTVQEWISVNDELPKVGEYVVCMAKRNPFSRFMPMVARIEKNGWVNPMTEQYISEVTHWMPIPHPPKGE